MVEYSYIIEYVHTSTVAVVEIYTRCVYSFRFTMLAIYIYII